MKNSLDQNTIEVNEEETPTGRKSFPDRFIFGAASSAQQVDLENSSDQEVQLGRTSFPNGFIFGASSSAYQIEGSANEGGRGPSIWDTFSHIPDKIDDGSNGDLAVDSYHRYKEDVKMLKNLGVDAYRFSISWSRILPTGSLKGGINSEGIDYYNNLINELLENDMKPFVTLFHWDVPQGLEDEYGGFLSPKIVDDFKNYAETCFQEFGDRVKHWITHNEPWSFTYGGYDVGYFAPGRSSTSSGKCAAGDSAREPYIVTHNLLLSHAAAVAVYKHKFQEIQKGEIGITLVSYWMEPYTNNYHDEEACERALEFMLGWYMEPLIYGDYPFIMKALVRERLPSFTESEKEMVMGSFDFVGINYYTARYASSHPISPNEEPINCDCDSHVDLLIEKDGVPIGPVTGIDVLPEYPEGIKKLLVHVTRRYNNPKIYITENGIGELDKGEQTLEQALNDYFRLGYYSRHLTSVLAAIKLGADVRGYFAWTLMDNFEWNTGFTIRFGLLYIDYKNSLARHKKKLIQMVRQFSQRISIILSI